MIYVTIVFLFAARSIAMTKSHRRKKHGDQRSASTGKPGSKEQKASSVNEEIDEKMDFGGLPARDLKKNLGCG